MCGRINLDSFYVFLQTSTDAARPCHPKARIQLPVTGTRGFTRASASPAGYVYDHSSDTRLFILYAHGVSLEVVLLKTLNYIRFCFGLSLELMLLYFFSFFSFFFLLICHLILKFEAYWNVPFVDKAVSSLSALCVAV